jgi:prevent-host-death family protein
MESIPVRELNQHTSAVLQRVQRGESLEVTVGGRPVARLVPLGEGASLLERMVAEGRALAPTAIGPVPVPPRLGDPAVNVTDELALEREDERW